MVNHDGGVGTSIDPLVWSAGSAPKKRRVAVRDRAFLPGPPELWVGSWITVAATSISCRDIEVWPYSVGMLVKWFAFLHSLHWPADGCSLAKTPHPQAAGTEYFPMTNDEGGELSAGMRPAPLEEERPQEKLQRHAGIGYEIAQSLDVPALQMVEQPLNVTQFFAAQLPVVAEPVIEVPKILPDRVPQRIVERRPPQMAEQLVEVPTILSFISLQQQTTEQIVDIPVPGRGGELGGLQGFHREQSSTAFLEQMAESPDRGEVFKIFNQSRVPQRLLRFLLDTLGQGFFGLFLRDKSPKVTRQVDEKLPADVSSSTPAACGRHHSFQ